MSSPPSLPTITEIRRLYFSGHLQSVIQIAGDLPSDSPIFAETAALATRALIEKPRFAEAAIFARESAGAAGDDEVLEMLAAMAEVLAQPNRTKIGTARSLANRLLRSDSLRNQAHGLRYLGRLIEIEINLCFRGINSLAEAREFYRRAAETFAACELIQEELCERRMWAGTYRKTYSKERSETRSKWAEVLKHSENAEDPVSTFQSQLTLAEIDLEDRLANQQNSEASRILEADIPEIVEAAEKANIVGCEAKTLASLGRILLKFGIEDGDKVLVQAAHALTELGLIGESSGIWSDLYAWHDRRGEPEKLIEVSISRPKVETTMNDQLGFLAEANHHFIRNEFADARAVIEKARKAASTPSQEAALLMQLSSIHQNMDRRDEAIHAAKEAVDTLERDSPTLLLSDAYFQLGMAYSSEEVTASLWEQAANIDLACGNTLAAATRYTNLAEFLGQHVQKSPHQNSLHRKFYERARELLEGENSLAGLAALADLHQKQGVSALLHNDCQFALDALNKAIEIYRPIQSISELAFTLAQRGLALNNLFRNGILEVSDPCYDCYQESRLLFQRKEQRYEEFRMLRLSAALSMESAQQGSPEAREQWLLRAETNMEAGAALVESLRAGHRDLAPTTGHENQQAFAGNVADFYEESFRFFLKVRGNAAAALLWMERGKARSLLEAMSLVGGSLRPPKEAEPALAAREERLLNERETLALDGPYESRLRWRAITGELESIWTELSKQECVAGYANMRLARPIDWPQWRTALRKQESLIEDPNRSLVSVHLSWPHQSRGQVNLIACKADWDQPLARTIDVDCGELDGFLRSCFPSGSHSTLRQYLQTIGDERGWSRRFSSLLAPLQEWTAPNDYVILIPQGPLHALPLHALLLEDGLPLAIRNPVVYAPSAAVLNYGWERDFHRSSGRIGPTGAVFGCDRTEGLLPLPRARHEAEFVARLLETSPRLDEEATPERFLKEASEADIVHFVGHGEESLDGWESALRFNGEAKVAARDFFQSNMTADLVTLSGCRTARSSWGQGDESLGLIPSLLRSGASSILASNWEVGDRFTPTLMKHFYHAAYGDSAMPKADALRYALTLVRNHYPDIVDWASFSLHGDWR